LAARRAFQPVKQNLAPALAARFASTDASKTGKIHQVIGAVVDGMQNVFLVFHHQLQYGALSIDMLFSQLNSIPMTFPPSSMP